MQHELHELLCLPSPAAGGTIGCPWTPPADEPGPVGGVCALLHVSLRTVCCLVGTDQGRIVLYDAVW